MPGGIGLNTGEGARLAGTTLINQDRPIKTGVEKPPMGCRYPGTGPAMQENHRNAIGIAAIFYIEVMPSNRCVARGMAGGNSAYSSETERITRQDM